jgi:CRISPR system Cascade subunit CasA
MHDEKTFSLLRENWILVRKPDGEAVEVSLLSLFRHAQDFQDLAGELPTQDVAILRLLLAILHAVFGRYDLEGNFRPISSPGEALERWKALWDRGRFPMAILEKYLMHFEERFWLFHPQYPFYQVAGIDKATEYTSAKLNGELSESGNKIRLFPQRAGDGKITLQYSEAARWLIHVNSFDDTSSKPKTKGLPSPGVGWLGKLGLITAQGDTLFETLLLNLVLLKDGGNELWGEEKPIWEADKVKSDERTEIPLPNNPSALLTLQSRRLHLERKGDVVVGYSLLGGDFFPKENALVEQMTIWKVAPQKKVGPLEYLPKRHDPSKQLWRDFSALVGQSEAKHPPGIVAWLSRLKQDKIIPRSHFRFQTAAIIYGDKDFFVDDVIADSLSFSADLLTNLGEKWVNRIIEVIGQTEELVNQVGYLAQNLAKAAGDTDGNSAKNAAKGQAYFRLDIPFRLWLEGIEPERDSMNDTINQWLEQARKIIRSFGRELVNEAGPQSFVGRYVKEKVKGKDVERRYTAPEAYNLFMYRTSGSLN